MRSSIRIRKTFLMESVFQSEHIQYVFILQFHVFLVNTFINLCNFKLFYVFCTAFCTAITGTTPLKSTSIYSHNEILYGLVQ